jgi:hypothetical protein
LKATLLSGHHISVNTAVRKMLGGFFQRPRQAMLYDPAETGRGYKSRGVQQQKLWVHPTTGLAAFPQKLLRAGEESAREPASCQIQHVATRRSSWLLFSAAAARQGAQEALWIESQVRQLLLTGRFRWQKRPCSKENQKKDEMDGPSAKDQVSRQ